MLLEAFLLIIYGHAWGQFKTNVAPQGQTTTRTLVTVPVNFDACSSSSTGTRICAGSSDGCALGTLVTSGFGAGVAEGLMTMLGDADGEFLNKAAQDIGFGATLTSAAISEGCLASSVPHSVDLENRNSKVNQVVQLLLLHAMAWLQGQRSHYVALEELHTLYTGGWEICTQKFRNGM